MRSGGLNFRLGTSTDGQTWTYVPISRTANPGIVFALNDNVRYVRITNGGDYLHLAEVEVFGSVNTTPVQHWGDFTAGACVDNTHRKFSAILRDIPSGISWEDACAMTPASIVHDTFAKPAACVNNGFNMWGEFKVRDGSCAGIPMPVSPPAAPAPIVGLSPSAPFSVVLASDPQLYWPMTNTEYPGAPWREGSVDEVEVTARSHVRAMRVLADGNQLPPGTTRPEAVIINGDLTSYARADQYNAYFRLYDEANLGMPRFDGLGNHDYGANVVGYCGCEPLKQTCLAEFWWEGPNFCARDSARRMRAWIQGRSDIESWDQGSMAYAFVRNNIRFLQLHNYPGYEVSSIGVTNSLAWLRTQLQTAAGQGQFVVLNMHIAGAISYGVNPSTNEPQSTPASKAAFEQAVAGYEHVILAVFGGHLHEEHGQSEYITVNGISIPVAYGGSQEYNQFTLVQFDLDKVTFRGINSRTGNATVVPGSESVISYRQQDIGAPLVNVVLANSSLTDAGSARTVTASGTLSVADRFNQANEARQLDGIDDVMTIDMNGWAESNTNTFTLAGWLNWDGVGTSQIGFLFGRDFERMEVHTGGDAGVNGLRFIPAGYGPSHVDAPNVLTPGWNHLAFTYTGNTSTIYVNGNQVAQRVGIGAPGAPAPIDLTTNSGDLRVGMRANGSFPLTGRVDDIVFYNHALSQLEIAKLMQQ